MKIYLSIHLLTIFALVTSHPCDWRERPTVIHGSGCKKYTVCRGNVRSEKQCPPGQLFDSDRGHCDYEELVTNCMDDVTATCPMPDGFYVKPGTGCREFYDCTNGKPAEYMCPQDQLFDENKGTCDWEELVNCFDKGTKFKCPLPFGRFLKPDSMCKMYYNCRNGFAVEVTCPHGHLFDETTFECRWEEAVSCRDRGALTTMFPQPGGHLPCPLPNGQFAKPGSQCRKYYSCRNGFATEIACDDGNLFDETLGRCDWEDLVSCNEKDPLCLRPTGNFPVRGGNCKYYASCSHGMATVVMCPNDWLFNEATGQCDWPELVHCRDDIITAESTDTTVKWTPSISGINSYTPTETTTSTDSALVSTETKTTSSASASSATYTTMKTTATSWTSSNSSPSLDFTSTTLSLGTVSQPTASNQTVSHPNTEHLTTTVTIPTQNTTRTKEAEPSTKPTKKSTPTITTSKITTILPTTTSAIPITTPPRGCLKFGDPDCPQDPTLCPERFGLFPHPDHKSWFIHCDHWRPYIKKCPDELHFDPKTQVCDWPEWPH